MTILDQYLDQWLNLTRELKKSQKVWRWRHVRKLWRRCCFSIYSQLGAIWKLDFGHMVCKTYIFINSSILYYKSWKQNLKIPNTTFTLLLWIENIFAKKILIFCKKKSDISKIKRALVLKRKIFWDYICVCTYYCIYWLCHLIY